MIRKFLFLFLIGAGITAPIFLDRNSENKETTSTFTTSQAPYPNFDFKNPGTRLTHSQLGHGINNTNSPSSTTQPIIWPGPTEPPERFYQPVTQFDEVIRFDVYPEWVKTRWNRVSSTPGEFDLQGMRVPLVTGNQTYDLSGSLTYYFDSNRQIQRILFQGWTGDPNQLVRFLSSEYGFKQQTGNHPGLFTKNKFFRTHSVLRLDTPALINQSEQQRQTMVYLELNHPQGNIPISTTAQQALDSGSH